MATIAVHSTHLESPSGQVNGAIFAVNYDDERHANVRISGMSTTLNVPTDGLRAELIRLAWAIESAAQSTDGMISAERQQDNSIIFEGRGPFELVLQGPPTARSEGPNVLVVLSVPFAGAPEDKVDIRLILQKEHADQLAVQLLAALNMAEVNSLKAR
jgi:hypothetical protein